MIISVLEGDIMNGLTITYILLKMGIFLKQLGLCSRAEIV